MDHSTLKKLQSAEVSILETVVKICDQYKIKYYLVGGTLLGAARHAGFIPWDDDLDIAIPRNDYDRFLDLCINGALGEELYLQHQRTEPNYWLPFAKVRINHTLFDEEAGKRAEGHKGIFIDVFPLDACKKNRGWQYHFKAKTVKKLSRYVIDRGLKRTPTGWKNKLLFGVLNCFELRKVSNFRDRLASSCKEGKYFINYGSNYKYQKQTMEKGIYEPSAKLCFEGHDYTVPGLYEQYLTKLFGDWRRLPPEEERRNHNPAMILFDTTAKGY